MLWAIGSLLIGPSFNLKWGDFTVTFLWKKGEEQASGGLEEKGGRGNTVARAKGCFTQGQRKRGEGGEAKGGQRLRGKGGHRLKGKGQTSRGKKAKDGRSDVVVILKGLISWEREMAC